MENNKKIGTESYKGVRDFFPEDWSSEDYVFSIWRKTVRSFGYEEYNASPIEYAELYRAKSGEEIANEQTYNFKDKGDREIALRPEMTPTVARMVAQKRKSLSFPLRLFSVPNLFRYEKPQKGRLREHFQLNVDIFGVSSLDADIEIIQIAYEIMSSFGFKDKDFQIFLNNRGITNFLFKDFLNLSEADAKAVAILIDKKDKMEQSEFEKALSEIVGENTQKLLTILNSKNIEEFISNLPKTEVLEKVLEDVKKTIQGLNDLGINNVEFKQSLVRGFDYYTGMVFEIFDTNRENVRSVFGGGRYDRLLSIFGEKDVPTVGFGMGDVVLLDMLKERNLLPAYSYPAKISICVIERSALPYANDLAQKMRRGGVGTILDMSDKKIGDQIKYADKKGIPYIVCVGEEEVKSGLLKLKELKTGKEIMLREDAVLDFFDEL